MKVILMVVFVVLVAKLPDLAWGAGQGLVSPLSGPQDASAAP